MKNKRLLLKISAVLELLYVLISFLRYVKLNKFNSTNVINIVLLFISAVLSIVLYRKSNEDLDKIKNSKNIIIICSIWLFLDSIIPGILGFIFLSMISDKKKILFPEDIIIKEKYKVLKSVVLIFMFILIMFVIPMFTFSKYIPIYLPYILILMLVILINHRQIINDLKVFISNIKLYIPYIIKMYFVMLGTLLLASILIVYVNSGNISPNQEVVNAMFKKLPIVTLILSTLYAPFTEENIFRLSLSNLIKNKYVFIIISGLLFGSLHIINKVTTAQDLIYILQYSLMGFCLAKAYSDSKNIFVPISIHFIQNLLAVIVMMIYL